MHPVDEYARLKSEIRRLETRANALRACFLAGPGRERSNHHEVVVEQAMRRVLLTEHLPEVILSDPRYWDARQSAVVKIRKLPQIAPWRPRMPSQRRLALPEPEREEDDIVLIE